MQSKDIEIFLEIVSSRNITKASEHMFLSQSVLSTRLKKLEDELGYELFSRSKGMREMELTKQGREFVSIAMRMRNLYEEAELLKAKSQQLVRLAVPESVYYDFLEPLIVILLRKHPEMKFSISIDDSSNIYDMMESGVIDFGFASYESSRTGILHIPLYRQSFKIVTYADFPEENGMISKHCLDPEKEIELSGGNFASLSLWRDRWFSSGSGSRVVINSPHMMVKLLHENGCWAILPETSADRMADMYGARSCVLNDMPESRMIYLLRHGLSMPLTDAASEFLTEMKLYTEDNQGLIPLKL